MRRWGIALGLVAILAAGCGTDGAPKYVGEVPAAQETFGSCALCHRGLADTLLTTGHGGAAGFVCTTCHDQDLAPGEPGLDHRNVPACTNAGCHPGQATHHDPATGTARQCAVCHTPHGSANLLLVRERIETPGGATAAIVFTNRQGLGAGSYASDTQPGTGVCEVCHTKTAYYRSDGLGATHFSFQCVACHPHSEGFPAPTSPPTLTPTTRPPATNTPTPTTPPSGPTETPTGTPVGGPQLRVQRVAEAPAGIDDPLWDAIAPYAPALADASVGLVYGDGQLNMTGTYDGLAGFNGGQPAALELRAAHDGTTLYLLAQWRDAVFHLDRRRWLFDGPADPRKPGESASGWTSQRNDDKIGFAFEIDAASSEFGTFAEAGCAAACHSVAGTGLDMRPAAGAVDIWHWKTSRSEPLGYVDDQMTTADGGRSGDSGTPIENRNRPPDGTNRSGPATEWDGTVQSFTRWDGQVVTLDPAYVLLDGHRMPVAGDAAAGQATYASRCAGCHGAGGRGTAIAKSDLTAPLFARMSRPDLAAATAAPTHPGAGSFTSLSAPAQTDLLARLRGFSGLPGYYLTPPDGSVADIVTQSNVVYAQVDDTARVTYRVLFIRPLDTGHADDAAFSPGAAYPFGVALMDNDGRNHIGATRQLLVLDP